MVLEYLHCTVMSPYWGTIIPSTLVLYSGFIPGTFCQYGCIIWPADNHAIVPR